MNLKQITSYLTLFFITITPALLHADISTDGTVGAAQTLTGPDYAIPETLGTVKGNNLFHSFEKFSIKTQETATFTGSDSIKNVISRVTGGEKSEIDGTLRSNVGKADFYFINPSGVVFGQNAKIDVPAAFHVSTSDELKFADGASFKASKSEQSTLTQASPEAFGFLGTQSASIEVNGSTLEFKPESKVSLTSSKDITLKGTKSGTEEKQASLTSAGGEIELKAEGDLTLDNARVESSGNGGGKVTVKAGNVKLHNKSKIAADNTGDKNVDGNGVEIKADKELEIKQSSRIQSNIFGSGDSGTVKVEAQNMLIKQQAGEEFTGVFIEVEPEAKGNGKSIDVKVKDKLTIQGAAGIPSMTYGYGNTASVNVVTGELLIDGEGRKTAYRNSENWIAGISSEANKISNGNANTVSVYVDHLLTMLNGCGISGSISGKGDAGNVIVKAENMKIDGQGSSNFTGIGSIAGTGSEGKAGTVEITVSEYLELLNGGQIVSSTFSKGDAGSVKINAENMKIDGQGNATGIASSAFAGSEGNAGKMILNIKGLLELLNGGVILSDTLAKGDAGSVKINAGNMKIDRQGGTNFTGIRSSAEPNSEGKAGTVEITVAEYLKLLNGGVIRSSTFSKGDAGSVKINSGNIKIDGQGSSYVTGVLSDASSNSSGNAGTVEITVAELLEVLNGGQIRSGTFSKGDAGSVKINSGNIKIDGQGSSEFTGITSLAGKDSEGNAGKVEITVTNLLELINGGAIGNPTFSKGDAGDVKINAKNMKIDGQGSSYHTGITSSAESNSSGNASTVEISVAEFLELLNGGEISSSTWSKGDAGNVKINAGNMKIDGQGISTGIESIAGKGSEGNAGTVEITVAEYLELLNGGKISSSTRSKGNAGDVSVNAGNMKINGQGIATGIESFAGQGSEGNAGTIRVTVVGLFTMLNSAVISSGTLSKGNAGEVIVKAALLELLNDGLISSSTLSKGNAGYVKINATNMKIDGQGSSGLGAIIASDTQTDSEGNAGTVEITVAELLEVLNGGKIRSSTFSKGDAGNVIINAKNMKIDKQGSSTFTGVSSSADTGSEGNAGTVEITVAELLEVLNGGQISSGTFSKGDAGKVIINANNMKIDRQGSNKFTGVGSSAEKSSEGKAGTVEITVAEYFELINGGAISSNTSSKGDAGGVIINAKNMKIDGQGSSTFTGVTSSAGTGSEGKAGTVEITVAELLEVLNGCAISSSTWSKGNAGNIVVNADKVFTDASFIQSGSAYTASGYVGNVSINANLVNLINGSKISIGAYQTLSPEKLANMPPDKFILTLKTRQLNIESDSRITSESTKNVPASNIKINSDVIYLKDGQINTSVSGTNGDGGNISINENAESAGFLVMQNGLIQANTSAEGSKGGRIRINKDTFLIADKSMPFQIGGEPEKFSLDDKKNIIQAADPSKNPQDIEAPEVPIDLSGEIINAGSKFSKPVEMAKNYCRLIGTKRASHLTLGGRGGIPEDIHKPASIFLTDERLEEFLRYEKNAESRILTD